MLGNMAEEALPNGFVESSISGSNPAVPKKKRNLPGTPGKNLKFFSFFFFFFNDEQP